MNAVGVEGNVGKNLFEFRQNEVKALEYGQSNANMNQRQVSLPACFLCGRTGHYYSVSNTYRFRLLVLLW